jgi:hypothetical protein
MKSKDCFIVVIPSNDKKAIIDSVEKLMYTSLILKRPLLRLSVTATGLANVRQSALDQLREIFPDEKEVYVFWCDSDVLLDEMPEQIAKYVLEAEKRNVSFSANYMGLTGNESYSTVFPYSETGEKLNYIPKEELAKHKPFELRIGHAGLGLCYVKTPLNYQFWTKAHQLDDYAFFTDNNIELYYVPIKNRHQKWLFLDGI